MHAVAQLAGSVTAALLTPATHPQNDKYVLGAKPNLTQQHRKKMWLSSYQAKQLGIQTGAL